MVLHGELAGSYGDDSIARAEQSTFASAESRSPTGFTRRPGQRDRTKDLWDLPLRFHGSGTQLLSRGVERSHRQHGGERSQRDLHGVCAGFGLPDEQSGAKAGGARNSSSATSWRTDAGSKRQTGRESPIGRAGQIGLHSRMHHLPWTKSAGQRRRNGSGSLSDGSSRSLWEHHRTVSSERSPDAKRRGQQQFDIRASKRSFKLPSSAGE